MEKVLVYLHEVKKVALFVCHRRYLCAVGATTAEEEHRNLTRLHGLADNCA